MAGRPIRTDLELDRQLARLLKVAKKHQITEAELQEQRVSFVYGNLAIDDTRFTKEQVREEARRLGLYP